MWTPPRRRRKWRRKPRKALLAADGTRDSRTSGSANQRYRLAARGHAALKVDSPTLRSLSLSLSV